jgi:putative transposase
MEKRTRKSKPRPDLAPVSLGELIHTWVRRAIETAVHEELEATLGAARHERTGARRGYRNGTRQRTLTGPTGPLPLTMPRATLRTATRDTEWRSTLVPRYARRLPEVNAAVVATYLAGGNQRRIRAALQPLLKAAPLSKSTVSRLVATLKEDLQVWQKRPLAELDVVYLYLDALVLRVRRDGQVEGVPVLAAVAVLADGQKPVLTLDLCSGESYEAWKGCLDDLVARGLKPPLLCILDGNAGLRRAVGARWRRWPCSDAACTSCGTSSVRRPSTRSPNCATTSIGSSTPRARRPRARRIPPSSASGRSAAPRSSRACGRGARSS